MVIGTVPKPGLCHSELGCSYAVSRSTCGAVRSLYGGFSGRLIPRHSRLHASGESYLSKSISSPSILKDGCRSQPIKHSVVEAAKKSKDKQIDKAVQKSSGLSIFKKDKDMLWMDGRYDWLHELDDIEDLPKTSFLDAVVKVYCTHSDPDYSLPWQKQRQFTSTGSGFVIAGKRLLTNAHCIENSTQVQVKKRGDDMKYVAKVLAEGPECDLALLTVENDEFWKGVDALQFGSLPRLQDPVIVVGYPVGGETISVTSGVVSRIEVTSYSHGGSELLAVQIDAAVNPGNSGGPAFNGNGDCVGIAFQGLRDGETENIGWLIPTAVVFHFLKDYERNGKYTGFPCLGMRWQRLENSALRTSLKMKPGQKGVLIRKVEPTAPAHNVIKEGDVLLSFDGIPIANEGTISFRTGERIDFEFLVTQKFSGEAADLEILRDGEHVKLRTTFKPRVQLIPVHMSGKVPSYFIIAGLVFVPVCLPFLGAEFGDENLSLAHLSDKARDGIAEFEDQQIVVLSQVLAHPVNAGYEDIGLVEVLSFNGERIRNLKHLAHLVDTCTEEFMKFELKHNILVVLETKTARLANPQILLDFGIPSERSSDMIERRADDTTQEATIPLSKL